MSTEKDSEWYEKNRVETKGERLYREDIMCTISPEKTDYDFRCHQALKEYDDFMEFVEEGQHPSVLPQIINFFARKTMNYYAVKYNVQIQHMRECWRGLEAHKKYVNSLPK